PSKNHFTLITTSGNEAPVQLRVTDNHGRLIETRKNLSSNGTYILGQAYRPGIYYAEVIQDGSRVLLKLIKQ
ncbi:MAG TPA: T9SS type A sorting domain-containing protein, partial [Segetibacter sp.]